MKKKIKNFLKDNAWVIIAGVDVAALIWFFYMLFGYAWETAQFYVVMRAIAG